MPLRRNFLIFLPSFHELKDVKNSMQISLECALGNLLFNTTIALHSIKYEGLRKSPLDLLACYKVLQKIAKLMENL